MPEIQTKPRTIIPADSRLGRAIDHAVKLMQQPGLSPRQSLSPLLNALETGWIEPHGALRVLTYDQSEAVLEVALAALLESPCLKEDSP